MHSGPSVSLKSNNSESNRPVAGVIRGVLIYMRVHTYDLQRT